MPERPTPTTGARRKIPVADWADIDLSDAPDRRLIAAEAAAQADDERLAGLVDGLLPPSADPVAARWESWADGDSDPTGTEPKGAASTAAPAGGWVEGSPPLGAHEVTTAAAAGWDAAHAGRGDSWVHALGRFVEPAPDAPRGDT